MSVEICTEVGQGHGPSNKRHAHWNEYVIVAKDETRLAAYNKQGECIYCLTLERPRRRFTEEDLLVSTTSWESRIESGSLNTSAHGLSAS